MMKSGGVVFAVLVYLKMFVRGNAVVLKTTEDATRVELPCHTSLDTAVDWWYQSSPDVNVRQVCLNGDIVIDLRSRLSIKSSAPGDYNLVINRPKVSDSGIYTCVEDAGLGPGRFEVRLNVSANNVADLQHKLLVTDQPSLIAAQPAAVVQAEAVETPQLSPAVHPASAIVPLVLIALVVALVIVIFVALRRRGINYIDLMRSFITASSQPKQKDVERNTEAADSSLLQAKASSGTTPMKRHPDRAIHSVQTTPSLATTKDAVTSPTPPPSTNQTPGRQSKRQQTKPLSAAKSLKMT